MLLGLIKIKSLVRPWLGPVWLGGDTPPRPANCRSASPDLFVTTPSMHVHCTPKHVYSSPRSNEALATQVFIRLSIVHIAQMVLKLLHGLGTKVFRAALLL